MSLGPPPDGSNPEAVYAHLEQVLTTLEQCEHPRVRPLKKRIRQALSNAERAAGRGTPEEMVARKLAADGFALQVQTYQLVATVISEFRVRVAKEVAKGVRESERDQAAALQEFLEVFGKATAAMVGAMKRKDAQGAESARQRMAQAQAKLGQCFAGPNGAG